MEQGEYCRKGGKELMTLRGFIRCAAGMLAAVLAIRLCAYAAGAVRERCFTALHTIPNKLTGLMVFLVPFALRTPWAVGYCAAACIVAAVAALHEMSLHLCAPQRAVEREAQAE